MTFDWKRILGSLAAGGAGAAAVAWLLTRGWAPSVVASGVGLGVAWLVWRKWGTVRIPSVR